MLLTLAEVDKSGLCETIKEHCSLSEQEVHQKVAPVVVRMVAVAEHQTIAAVVLRMVAVVEHQTVAAVGKSLPQWGRGTMRTAYFRYVRKMAEKLTSTRWVLTIQ